MTLASKIGNGKEEKGDLGETSNSKDKVDKEEDDDDDDDEGEKDVEIGKGKSEIWEEGETFDFGFQLS